MNIIGEIEKHREVKKIKSEPKLVKETNSKYTDSNSEIGDIKILGMDGFSKSVARPTKYTLNKDERRRQQIMKKEALSTLQRQKAIRSKLHDKDHAVL